MLHAKVPTVQQGSAQDKRDKPLQRKQTTMKHEHQIANYEALRRQYTFNMPRKTPIRRQVHAAIITKGSNWEMRFMKKPHRTKSQPKKVHQSATEQKQRFKDRQGLNSKSSIYQLHASSIWQISRYLVRLEKEHRGVAAERPQKPSSTRQEVHFLMRL